MCSISNQVLNSEFLVLHLIHILILANYDNSENCVIISYFFHGSDIQGSK